MRTPLGLVGLISVGYVPDHMQCPYYSGCPYFRGVHKAGFHCSSTCYYGIAIALSAFQRVQYRWRWVGPTYVIDLRWIWDRAGYIRMHVQTPQTTTTAYMWAYQTGRP